MAIVQTGIDPQAIDVLLIGFGRIARDNSGDLRSGYEPETYTRALTNSSENFCVSVTDTNPDSVNAAANFESVRTFSTFDDALESQQFGIAIIATPDDTHFGIAVKLLNLPTPPSVLIIEKPVCSSSEQLDQLEKTAESKQVQILVNHTRRFDDEHQNLARQIQSGQFGTPRRVNAHYYGGWIHNGIHIVDVIQMLLGTKIAIESAQAVGSHDRLDVTGTSKQAVISIDSTDDLPYQFFEYSIFCDKALIRFSDFGHKITIEQAITTGGETVLDTESKVTLEALVTPIQNLLETAIDALNTGQRTSLGQVREAMEPIWSAQKLSTEDPH